MKEIGFYHGAMREKYEKQANEQGYTLGEFAETAEKIRFGLAICNVHNILTDSVYNKALQKLNDKIVQHLKPMEEE